MKNSFRSKVLDACKSYRDQAFTVADVAVSMDIIQPKERHRVGVAMWDLMRADEIKRVAQGTYINLHKKKPPQMREVLWRLLRARRRVTVADLMQLSDASEKYIRECLGLWQRLGVVKNTRKGRDAAVYILIKDQLETPRDDAKAARLKDIREKKKEALAALDSAFASIAEARLAVSEIPEED